MDLDLNNQEWQEAMSIVENSRRSLFLTGKAGTGKSTFLRYISQHTKKKHVILAPTGIAAINAGGCTLHSFFHLPFHPLLPNDARYSNRNMRKTLKYSGDHIKLLREVELIIIDEISMVRADIIDFIDRLLRVYSRRMHEPFGGKQLLLVGDIFQLEPVLKEDERRLVQPFYTSSYFFSAKVWQEMQLVSIELRKVYRQKDLAFIGILDRIRENCARDADLKALNTRVGAQLDTNNGKLAITLASHRGTVDYINDQHLSSLLGEETVFNGEIKGEFPITSLPTPMELHLKPGAQVIFVKNDKDKRWVNGTLGVISTIDEEKEMISVVSEDGAEFDVEREMWENVRYTYNEKEKKIDEEQLGVYKQFPLRLAWAITIHKSQGLTFNQVNIDFTGGVFAGGQTYVALSRCTSLDGISLKEPVNHSDIFIRSEVVSFARQYNNRQLLERALSQDGAASLYRMAISAFDRRDFSAFLTNFFKAIHSNYVIESPVAQRYIRRKLDVINQKDREIEALREQQRQTGEKLKMLAAEYTLMGRECEREKMFDAAMRNYQKALELYKDAGNASRRLQQLIKRQGKSTPKKK